MKIAIDISPIVYGTGVSVYTKNLIESLLEIDKENEYLFLGMSMRRGSEIKDYLKTLKGGNFKSKTFPIAPTLADIVWNIRGVVPIETLTGRIDVFHSSDWTQPPSKAFSVTTIHDFSPIKFPEYTPKKIVEVHTRRLNRVKKIVDRVIVPSDATKKQAIDFGIAEDKIRVIYEGNDEVYKESTELEIDTVRKKYILSKYLLAVGTNPRKNTQRIIDAFRGLEVKDMKLVIVGEKSDHLKNTSGVIFTGRVTEEELITLFSGAEALVYVSIDEGFGLPILHAFSTNTPVVTSNVSSMPEVAGSAAVLVDPLKVNEITDGISNALKNKGTLVNKGKEQVKKFTWKKNAEETLKVYQESSK